MPWNPWNDKYICYAFLVQIIKSPIYFMYQCQHKQESFAHTKPRESWQKIVPSIIIMYHHGKNYWRFQVNHWLKLEITHFSYKWSHDRQNHQFLLQKVLSRVIRGIIRVCIYPVYIGRHFCIHTGEPGFSTFFTEWYYTANTFGSILCAHGWTTTKIHGIYEALAKKKEACVTKDLVNSITYLLDKNPCQEHWHRSYDQSPMLIHILEYNWHDQKYVR